MTTMATTTPKAQKKETLMIMSEHEKYNSLQVVIACFLAIQIPFPKNNIFVRKVIIFLFWYTNLQWCIAMSVTFNLHTQKHTLSSMEAKYRIWLGNVFVLLLSENVLFMNEWYFHKLLIFSKVATSVSTVTRSFCFGEKLWISSTASYFFRSRKAIAILAQIEI